MAKSLATDTLSCYCGLCPLLADHLPLPGLFPSSEFDVIQIRRVAAGLLCGDQDQVMLLQ